MLVAEARKGYMNAALRRGNSGGDDLMLLWSRVKVPFCLLNRHAPVRDHAKWDGKHYAGTCRHCGEAIVRRSRGVWVRGLPEAAFSRRGAG